MLTLPLIFAASLEIISSVSVPIAQAHDILWPCTPNDCRVVGRGQIPSAKDKEWQEYRLYFAASAVGSDTLCIPFLLNRYSWGRGSLLKWYHVTWFESYDWTGVRHNSCPVSNYSWISPPPIFLSTFTYLCLLQGAKNMRFWKCIYLELKSLHKQDLTVWTEILRREKKTPLYSQVESMQIEFPTFPQLLWTTPLESSDCSLFIAPWQQMNAAPCIQGSSHLPPSDPRCGLLTWAAPWARRSLRFAAILCQTIWKAAMKARLLLPCSCCSFVSCCFYRTWPSWGFAQAHSFLAHLLSFTPSPPTWSSICIHCSDSLSWLYPLIINLIFGGWVRRDGAGLRRPPQKEFVCCCARRWR